MEFCLNPELVYRLVGEEIIGINCDNNLAFHYDESATDIIFTIDKTHDIKETAKLISQVYSCSLEEVLNVIEEFIQELIKDEILLTLTFCVETGSSLKLRVLNG